MKHGFKVALIYIVIIGILVIAAAYLYNMTPQKELRYSDIVELSCVNGNTLVGTSTFGTRRFRSSAWTRTIPSK